MKTQTDYELYISVFISDYDFVQTFYENFPKVYFSVYNYSLLMRSIHVILDLMRVYGLRMKSWVNIFSSGPEKYVLTEVRRL
jgi:hypothetical protein